jgi:hypothetical protein
MSQDEEADIAAEDYTGPMRALPVPLASAAARDLLASISRFEFALKETGFVVGKEGGKVGPNWREFEALVEQSAFDEIRSIQTICILFDDPPRKQVRNGSTFQWSAPVRVTNIHELCGAIRQVRNNLFHGGKAGANPRDDELCRAATVALLYLANVHYDVRASFLGEY